MTRHGLYGGVLLAVAMTTTSRPAQAQYTEDSGTPTMAAENVPLFLGNPGTHGFYTFGEFMVLTQSRALGSQTIAVRGLRDATGLATGAPGTLIGTGRTALSTDMLGRSSWSPGYSLGIGYKLDNGTSVSFSYSQMLDQTQHAGASLVPQRFAGPLNLADTFLTADVFNFPPQYAGPLVKTPFDDANGNRREDPFEGGTFYGIWNGAALMNITYTQRFTQAEIGARVPLFQTDHSRIYGLAGGRFNWLFERFTWRTESFRIDGQNTSDDAADYNNTLSQRMYGPYVGCGHEVYFGSRFSLSLDTTAAVLLNVVKQRAKYELGDETIQAKRSRDMVTVVPSLTANLNLWWYPIEGVQMRLGYNAWTYFNTQYMDKPVDFNYGGLDPGYETKWFRLVHGVNAGVGLFF